MKTVLLVDDDKMIRDCATFLLTTMGLEVTAFENPKLAIEALNSGALFDAVVTDNDMPEMSGVEFVSYLRDKGYWMQVIMVSGTCDAAVPKAVESLRARFFEKTQMTSALKSLVNVDRKAA